MPLLFPEQIAYHKSLISPDSLYMFPDETNPPPEEDPADTGTGGSGGSTGGDTGDPVMEDPNPEGERPDGPAHRRYFVMMVGINDYPEPISKLNGCIKDLDQIEKWLRTHIANGEEAVSKINDIPLRTYGQLLIYRMEDAQATYHNIIGGFKDFLCQAGPKDVVWFHFSGHGSEQYTAKEFLSLEPNGKDQTLVCYKTRPEHGELHLADKELAVLLHEVATRDAMGRRKQSPHIVVSLDNCHSGSGTRDFAEDPLLKTRNTKIETFTTRAGAENAKAIRTLGSYVNKFYEQQLSSQGKLSVPLSDHMLLSACESVQKAGDMPTGGVFTSGLVAALTSSKGELNYSDLFLRTRAKVQERRKEAQTPQFQTVGVFNPFTRFLDGGSLGNPDRYEVKYEMDKSGKERWFVKCGSIHGLPMNPKKPIELNILTAAPDNKQIGKATIEAISAQKCSVRDIELNEGGKLETGTTYQGEILFLPAEPIFVWVHGDESGVELIRKNWDSSKNIQMVSSLEEAGNPQLEIEASIGRFLLTDRKNGRKVLEESQSDEVAKLLVDSVDQIAKWERMITLNNGASAIRDWARLELEVEGAGGKKTVYTGNEIKIFASDKNFNNVRGNLLGGFTPKVRITHTDQTLYCYMFHLRTNYSINSYEGEVTYRTEEHDGQAEVLMPMWKKTKGWGLGPQDDHAVSYFKLIVTTERLDFQYLLQTGIGGNRDAIDFDWNPMAVEDDWYAHTMKVTLVREKDEISPDREANLAGGKIRIKPHSGVKGKLGISTASSGERSADPSSKFSMFSNADMQLMDFASERDLSRQNVLEINDLEVSADLKENPLELVLDTILPEGEALLPIAFDGENFRVIGDSQSENGETVVKIRDLPEVKVPEVGDGVANPFGEEEVADRSLFRSLKMAFFRVALGRQDQNLLRWVQYHDDGTFEYREEFLKEKVNDEKNKNILVVVHGIAGNTTNVLSCLPFALGEDSKCMKDRFDLILAYDYENLNSPIETSAAKLKQALHEAGIHEGDNKRVTLIATSMGGLVSRWMVEQLAGKDFIDHLILVGTPSQGSNFGKIEAARKFSVAVLDIALNFVPNMVPFSGFLLKSLRGTAEVMVSLGQMDPGSEFLRLLNGSPDPGIPYTIIAGDAQKFEATNKGFKNLKDRLFVELGEWVNQKERHDVAVELKSIRNEETWARRNQQVQIFETDCHHLNYYYHEPGIQTLGRVKIGELS